MTGKIKTVHLERAPSLIKESTPIVRYMKLETLLLMLDEGLVFIPSYETLSRGDRLETGILFDLPERWKFWENWSDKTGSWLEDFANVFNRPPKFNELNSDGTPVADGASVEPSPSVKAKNTQDVFRQYVNVLAMLRCIWCWNKFRSFSNALWYIYGERGVAVTSTVGRVKASLVKAGVLRGIVAPIAYVNHERPRISKLITQENIFRPYLFKSIAYDYENEVRFVLGANWGPLGEKGGLLIPIDAVDFIDNIEPSPHLQREEQSAVRKMVKRLIERERKERKNPSLSPDWIECRPPFSDLW
jgi:hypothetical protein